MNELRLLPPYITHDPGPNCDRFTPHRHGPDGEVWSERPGMYRSPKAARWLGFWMIIGAGVWATAIGIGIAVVRRLAGS